nr:DNA helicase [Tanacetum cinerariifolium]
MRLNSSNLQDIDTERVSIFAQWLLDIGNGNIGTPDECDPENCSWVDIPEHYCIPHDGNGISNLINFIYDNETLRYPSAMKLQDKAIVCPKNDTTDIINNKILALLLERAYTYLSYDEAIPHGQSLNKIGVFLSEPVFSHGQLYVALLRATTPDGLKDFSDSNDKFSLIDDDSFSIDNIDYVEASPSDSELVSSEVMEIVIPEVGGIDDDILLTIKDDILREKLLNVNLLIAKIEALNDNLTPSSDFMIKSSSTSLNSLLEKTNTCDNSLLEFETFCFDVEEISSGSTTTHFDISLPEYEVFYDDHVKEISSGSTFTHSDSPLYDSFIFDLSINPFPPADRSIFMSSPMNSFTSYLHQSMIVSSSRSKLRGFHHGCGEGYFSNKRTKSS